MRKTAAEKTFDAGLAEWADVIGAHCGAHGGGAQIAFFRQRLRLVERQRHLVGEAERQAARGVDFCRQGRMKADGFVADQIGRHGDDDLVGGQRTSRGLDADALCRMIDQRHHAIERERTCRAVGGNQRTIAAADAPVEVGILIGLHIEKGDLIELAAIDVG